MLRTPFVRGLAALALVHSSIALQSGLDSSQLSAIQARAIGPAGMSGRVAAIEALRSDPRVIYVGAATGGLWKTEDEALTWEPLFDDQDVASIGAIAVHPLYEDIVWVGTGEGNPRNSSSVGKGLFRSLDGGATWTHLGLERTEKIHRVLLHPTDPDVAWIAALGTTWGENPERGVYKTTDGGATFERVLFVDERTGCADLAIDPRNPRKLFAAMWDHRRTPDFFRSGGPGSGLYMSLDGGDSWTKQSAKDGLPKGELGRIGVAFAPSDSHVVYALVEAEESALCRSDDGGFSWRKVNTDTDVSPRPFYYADVRVDPQDPDRVYRLASVVSVSGDAGKTFRTLMPWSLIHPDHHALWIHPEDPNWIVDGNDGGVAISKNRGETWRFVRNLPLAQYYHVAVDQETPFNVYGGMQDNGSWRGPSTVWENGGIRNQHWEEVGFGDGFATIPLPGDANQGYAMSQGGSLMRWNRITGERKNIKPLPPARADGEEEETALRFNWNAGIAIDPFDSDTVYYGSQFVHRSRNRGDSWDIISPDLTTNRSEWQRQDESGGLTPDVTAAENFTSILTIAPSALQQDVIWVGTDDGRIHVTRDGGETWESVEENLLDAPRNTWVAHIEASKFDAATAFVALDDHRRSNWTTFLFKTTDYGKTWESIATADIDGYAHAIEQDPVDPDLLFVGTEFGLWVTTDGGVSWFQWTNGLPTVSVRALVVHERDHDLVVATHGRAAFVIDDIRPLRGLSKDVLAEPVRLFPLPPAILHGRKQTGASRFPGSNEFRGETRDRGALITFSIGPDEGEKEEGEDEEERELEVEILDANGDVLRTLRPSPKVGLNRVVWRMDRAALLPGDEEPGSSRTAGPPVLPGTYTVHVHYGEAMDEGTLEVLPDPRVPYDEDARRANLDARFRVSLLGQVLTDAGERIDEVLGDIDTVLERASAMRERDSIEKGDDDDPFVDLEEAAEALREKFDDVDKRLRSERGTKGITRSENLQSDWGSFSWKLGSSYDAPAPDLMQRLEAFESELSELLDELNALVADDVPTFDAAVEEADLHLFPAYEPLSLP